MARNGQREYELIAHEHPKSPVAEAYRMVRTNLGFSSLDRPCRSIMVTSANPQDGKSQTAANLAVVMAQAGHKVIVVDCDLRKPAQHKIFELENRQGITNWLTEKRELEEVVKRTDIDNLSVLTSGPIPPNPAEILNAERTRSLWPQLLEQYDYVLVDSPPLLAVTDAAVLSTQVDGVLMVVSSQVTKKEMAKEAKEQLVKANARIIGVILNQVKLSKQDYQYYYYYYSEKAE